MTERLVNDWVSDGVAVLELSNPPTNTYSNAMFRQPDEAILEARFDDDVRVLLIRGAGDKRSRACDWRAAGSRATGPHPRKAICEKRHDFTLPSARANRNRGGQRRDERGQDEQETAAREAARHMVRVFRSLEHGDCTACRSIRR